MDASGLTIVAVDPGKMTGWAMLKLGEFSSGQIPGSAFLLWIDMAIEQGLMPSIVCEDFIYTAQTAKKTRQTYSTESIGVLRFLSYKHDLSFTLQAPVDAKKFSTNDKLKAMDWYTPTKGGHANDAARHLLLYGVKRSLIDPRKLLTMSVHDIHKPDHELET